MSYTTNVGDQLVIWISAETAKYIAEVTQEDPLRMKVEETGPFANLKDGDFIIKDRDTEVWQEDGEAKQWMLRTAKELGHPFLSGLHSLGVTDGKLHEIWPTNE